MDDHVTPSWRKGADMEPTTSHLKLMMDYTLFHIGAYITLTTLLVALLGLEGFKQRAAGMKVFLLATLVCFVIAGICGGIVASNIPYFQNFEALKSANIGPFFSVPAWPMVCWTSLEHIAFWAGVFFALVGVIKIVFYGSNTVRTAADTASYARQVGSACLKAAKHVETKHVPALTKMANELLDIEKAADANAGVAGRTP
jgi:hypothetical protein